MLRISAQSEMNETLLHTHTGLVVVCGYDLSQGPPLSHWSVGGAGAQRTQLPRLFIALLLPPKEKEHKGL